jgi:hypothetical protein
MIYYDYQSRIQLASEHADRVADDYERANARRSRRSRSQPPPALSAAASEARRRAARPQGA